MGSKAPRDQDRSECVAAQDQYGRGTWRQVRPLRFPLGGRRGNGLHPMATGPGGLSMAEPFTLSIPASDDDIDELGHVTNAVWVKWIQDVATRSEDHTS